MGEQAIQADALAVALRAVVVADGGMVVLDRSLNLGSRLEIGIEKHKRLKM
jgi:hypothetical protein